MSTSKRIVIINLPSDTADWLRETARFMEQGAEHLMRTHGSINHTFAKLHWSRIRRALQPHDATQKGGQRHV